MTTVGSLPDSFGRVMRDVRVSVTDRCNFRCMYCLPETEEAANFYRTKFDAIKNPAPATIIAREWKPRSQILTFEEIERVVRVLAGLGIEKVRVTGGEPLLRQGLETLIAKLSRIDGIRDLAMTTNGFLFTQKAEALRAAGLRRISFSLDSLDPANFKKMTGRDGLREVLAGIALAKRLGLDPVKVNAVVIRGINDHELEALAQFAREEDLSFRFIEFMPLDSGRVWLKELVVPGREILQRLQARFELKPVISANAAETARRWAFAEGRGEIGIIAPVTEPFCGHCNRLRLTADGKVRTCLFSPDGTRSEAIATRGRGRCRDRRTAPRHCLAEGGSSSHRRVGLRSTRAHDELHRRITSRGNKGRADAILLQLKRRRISFLQTSNLATAEFITYTVAHFEYKLASGIDP